MDIARVVEVEFPQFDELGSEKVMFMSDAETLSLELSEDMSVSKEVCAVAKAARARMNEVCIIIAEGLWCQ